MSKKTPEAFFCMNVLVFAHCHVGAIGELTQAAYVNHTAIHQTVEPMTE